MDTQQEIADAARRIGKRLGTDVYGVFDEQRHLIDLAIVGAIAFALMKDYLTGFVDMKKLGQSHRAALAGLVQRIRAGTVTADDRSPSSVEADLAAARRLAGTAELAQRHAAALERLQLSLKELGLAQAEAAACAADISAIVSRVLEPPR